VTLPFQGTVFRKAGARVWDIRVWDAKVWDAVADALAALTADGSRGRVMAWWDRAGNAVEALRRFRGRRPT